MILCTKIKYVDHNLWSTMWEQWNVCALDSVDPADECKRKEDDSSSNLYYHSKNIWTFQTALSDFLRFLMILNFSKRDDAASSMPSLSPSLSLSLCKKAWESNLNAKKVLNHCHKTKLFYRKTLHSRNWSTAVNLVINAWLDLNWKVKKVNKKIPSLKKTF